MVEPEGGIFLSGPSPSTPIVTVHSDEAMFERLALVAFWLATPEPPASWTAPT
jgi:hypothetical protein